MTTIRQDTRPLLDRMRDYQREPKAEAMFKEAVAENERLRAELEQAQEDATERAADIASISLMLEQAQSQAAKMRVALEGLLAEWDKFARYGSKFARNERVEAARQALATLDGAPTDQATSDSG